MVVGVSTWTGQEWQRHADWIEANFNAIGARLDSSLTAHLDQNIIGASWRIAKGCIKDLERAKFEKEIPADMQETITKLHALSNRVAKKAQKSLGLCVVSGQLPSSL